MAAPETRTPAASGAAGATQGIIGADDLHLFYPKSERRSSAAVFAAREIETRARWRRRSIQIVERTGVALPPLTFDRVREHEHERVLRDQYGAVLPNDVAGRMRVREGVSNMVSRPDPALYMRGWARRWAPWLAGAELDDMISDAIATPIRFTADVLGARLGLTMANRQRLRIRTIGAVDCSRAERAARRYTMKLARQRERDTARRRADGAATRADYVAGSVAEFCRRVGISRQTYYRAKKAGALGRYRLPAQQSTPVTGSGQRTCHSLSRIGVASPKASPPRAPRAVGLAGSPPAGIHPLAPRRAAPLQGNGGWDQVGPPRPEPLRRAGAVA